MKKNQIAGFITPPDWFDPSPGEFRDIMQGRAEVQQTLLDLPRFDWALDSVAQTEPQIRHAACQLAAAQCSIIANVGTPFGWAGLKNITEARARNQHLSEASGATCISTASAIFSALDTWGAKKVVLACTYYPDEWRNRWHNFVTASGVDVLAAQTMTDQKIMPPHDSDDPDYWAPSAAQITESVSMIAEAHPNADAIVITGAGSRTYAIWKQLQALTSAKVIASDTALYLNLATELGFAEMLDI